MSSKTTELRRVIGYGDDVEEASQSATNQYNSIENRTVFHKADIFPTTTGKIVVIIWLTEEHLEQINPTFEYIGSRGIDPNDPDWREKLFPSSAVIDASVASQDGSGATEDTNP
jgi:hypothetical protein